MYECEATFFQFLIDVNLGSNPLIVQIINPASLNFLYHQTYNVLSFKVPEHSSRTQNHFCKFEIPQLLWQVMCTLLTQL